jgi:hypothetical protein
MAFTFGNGVGSRKTFAFWGECHLNSFIMSLYLFAIKSKIKDLPNKCEALS